MFTSGDIKIIFTNSVCILLAQKALYPTEVMYLYQAEGGSCFSERAVRGHLYISYLETNRTIIIRLQRFLFF